jgi:hypothetical protein
MTLFSSLGARHEVEQLERRLALES